MEQLKDKLVITLHLPQYRAHQLEQVVSRLSSLACVTKKSVIRRTVIYLGNFVTDGLRRYHLERKSLGASSRSIYAGHGLWYDLVTVVLQDESQWTPARHKQFFVLATQTRSTQHVNTIKCETEIVRCYHSLSYDVDPGESSQSASSLQIECLLNYKVVLVVSTDEHRPGDVFLRLECQLDQNVFLHDNTHWSMLLNALRCDYIDRIIVPIFDLAPVVILASLATRPPEVFLTRKRFEHVRMRTKGYDPSAPSRSVGSVRAKVLITLVDVETLQIDVQCENNCGLTISYNVRKLLYDCAERGGPLDPVWISLFSTQWDDSRTRTIECDALAFEYPIRIICIYDVASVCGRLVKRRACHESVVADYVKIHLNCFLDELNKRGELVHPLMLPDIYRVSVDVERCKSVCRLSFTCNLCYRQRDDVMSDADLVVYDIGTSVDRHSLVNGHIYEVGLDEVKKTVTWIVGERREPSFADSRSMIDNLATIHGEARNLSVNEVSDQVANCTSHNGCDATYFTNIANEPTFESL
jgi:hypothetical protein